MGDATARDGGFATAVEATNDDALVLRVLRDQTQAFIRHAPAARSGTDADAVHDMRVATRRLRAALRVFKDVLPDDAQVLNDELRWIARKLGAVRDLDVQIKHACVRANELCQSDALKPYIAWLSAERERRLCELIGALDDERYEQLVAHLRRAGEWPVVDGRGAGERIQKTMKKLHKAARGLDVEDPASAFHQARIRAKRLRYTVEFHTELYGDPAHDVVKRTVQLQDALGELQDGVVSREHVAEAQRQAAQAWSPATMFALGQLVERDAAHGRELREQALGAYRKLRKKAWPRLRSAASQST